MCLTEAILIGLRRIDLRPIAPDKLWQHCTDKGSRVDWRPPPDTSDEPANAP
jgi:hypothetical protein